MVFLIIHIVCGIILIVILCLTGYMENALKFGDGIRFAKPSDIVLDCMCFWEVLVLFKIFSMLEDLINLSIGKLLGDNKNE